MNPFEKMAAKKKAGPTLAIEVEPESSSMPAAKSSGGDEAYGLVFDALKAGNRSAFTKALKLAVQSCSSDDEASEDTTEEA